MREDKQVLRMATGYFELGMYPACEENLDLLDSSQAAESRVLELRLLIAIERREWNEAIEFADRLTGIDSGNLGASILKAYGQRELGLVEEGLRTLCDWEPAQDGEEDRDGLTVYFYNFACYSSLLAKIHQAWMGLELAIALDPKLTGNSKNDPDPENLRAARAVPGEIGTKTAGECSI